MPVEVTYALICRSTASIANPLAINKATEKLSARFLKYSWLVHFGPSLYAYHFPGLQFSHFLLTK